MVAATSFTNLPSAISLLQAPESNTKTHPLRSLSTSSPSLVPPHFSWSLTLPKTNSIKRAANFIVRASSESISPSESSRNGNKDITGPLVPESPSGQLLVQLLKSHPHLFSAAVDQELEKLSADRSAIEDKSATSENELTLYKRIHQVRESERRKAIEEVIYSLIVQRFVTAGSPLLPKVPFIDMDPNIFPFAIKNASSNVKQLESVHSEEALEMVREHLSMILGQPSGIPATAMEDRVIVSTSKLRMGQIYGASIMYGYFLRRVDQRFQLEKTMKALTTNTNINEVFESEFSVKNNGEGLDVSGIKSSGAGGEQYTAEKKGDNTKISKLRAYVSSFDTETLQRSAALRSKESLGVIENHTEALFGKPQLMIAKDGSIELPKDDSSQLTLSTLRRLILEAIAFGSFLWDVESYVDSHYKIVNQ